MQFSKMKKLKKTKRFKWLVMTLVCAFIISPFKFIPVEATTTTLTQEQLSQLPKLPTNYLYEPNRSMDVVLPPEVVNVYNYQQFSQNIIQYAQIVAPAGAAATIATTTASLAGPAVALAGMAIFGGYLVWHGYQMATQLPPEPSVIYNAVPDDLMFSDSLKTQYAVDELGNLRMSIFENYESSRYQFIKEIMANSNYQPTHTPNTETVYEVLEAPMSWFLGTDSARVFPWHEIHVDIPNVKVTLGQWNTSAPHYESFITITSTNPDEDMYFSRYGFITNLQYDSTMFYKNEVTIGGRIHGEVTPTTRPMRIYQNGKNSINRAHYELKAKSSLGNSMGTISCKVGDSTHLSGCAQISTDYDWIKYNVDKIYLSDVLNAAGIQIWSAADYLNYETLAKVNLKNRDYAHEITIDKEIIEKVNPNVEWNQQHQTYVYKDTNQAVNPGHLHIPLPDKYEQSTGAPSYSDNLKDVITNTTQDIPTKVPTPSTNTTILNPNPTPSPPLTQVQTPETTPPETETPPETTPPESTPPESTPPETPDSPTVDPDQSLLQQILDWFLQFPAWLMGLIQPMIDVLTNIWNWISQTFTEFMQSVSNFFSNFSVYFQNLMDLLNNLYNNVVDFFTSLPEILSNLFSSISQSLQDFFQNAQEFFNQVIDSIVWLKDYLAEGISELFIPSERDITDFTQSLQGAVNQKVPLFTQLHAFFTSFFFASPKNPPEVTITLPEMWGGTTHKVINFEYFTEYRPFIINFTRLCMWWPFLKRLYARLPDIINNNGGSNISEKPSKVNK